MEANIAEVKKLIKERFRNNNTWFAEELEIDATYLSTILNNPEKSNSNKFCNSLIKYCETHGLDFKDYIFLK